MKHRAIILIMAGSLLLACDRTDHKEVVQPEDTLLTPQAIPELTPDPVVVNDNTAVSPDKLRQIDTSISPEMVKGIRFDANSDNDSDVYSDKPFNLKPAGNTRISVTPKLYIKEELDFSQGYMDNIDGASVEVEMKFD